MKPAKIAPQAPIKNSKARKLSSEARLKGSFASLKNLLKSSSTRELQISAPISYTHELHVGFDEQTGELTGLPEQWRNLLDESGITLFERKARPDAVIDVLKMYQEMTKQNDIWTKIPARQENIPPRPAHTLSVYSTDKLNSALSSKERLENPNSSRKGSKDNLKSTDNLGSKDLKPVIREKIVPSNSGSVSDRLNQICNPADPTTLYKKFIPIGQGASGSVFTAITKETKQVVAIKQMDLKDQIKQELIVNEILVMRDSNHPNVVNFIDSFLHKNVLWVVMEFMEGGSLTEVVTATIMTEKQMAAICKEVLLGLEHLHSQQIIHRDIKSDNILLSMEGKIKLSNLI